MQGNTLLNIFTASQISLLLSMCQPIFLGNKIAMLKGSIKPMYIKYTKVCPFDTNIKPLLKYNAVHILSSMQFLLSFYAFSKHCTSESGGHYRFSLSHDDCSCLFVITGSDVDTSNPRIFSTCADCLRRMMLRGVLEPRGATKLRGASGDLWPAELDPNNLLVAGLTAYDTQLLFDDFSPAVALSLTAHKEQYMPFRVT